jgi:hypothetical protein
MSFGAPRGISRLSPDGRILRLAGWKYDLNLLNGVLLDSQQRTEERTVIQESGGHGTMVGGTGYVTPRQEAVKDVTKALIRQVGDHGTVQPTSVSV